MKSQYLNNQFKIKISIVWRRKILTLKILDRVLTWRKYQGIRRSKILPSYQHITHCSVRWHKQSNIKVLPNPAESALIWQDSVYFHLRVLSPSLQRDNSVWENCTSAFLPKRYPKRVVFTSVLGGRKRARTSCCCYSIASLPLVNILSQRCKKLLLD